MEHEDHKTGEPMGKMGNCEMGMDKGPKDMCKMNDGGAMQPKVGGRMEKATRGMGERED